MAEGFRDGSEMVMVKLSQEKRKHGEGEGEGEGEGPVKGLVTPLISSDPDLDISTPGSKSDKASNPGLFSPMEFEGSHSGSKRKLGGSSGEDLLGGKGKRRHEGECGEGEDPLQRLLKPLTSSNLGLTISAPNPDDAGDGDERDDLDDSDNGGTRSTKAKSSRPQKNPKLGETEGGHLLCPWMQSFSPMKHPSPWVQLPSTAPKKEETYDHDDSGDGGATATKVKSSGPQRASLRAKTIDLMSKVPGVDGSIINALLVGKKEKKDEVYGPMTEKQLKAKEWWDTFYLLRGPAGDKFREKYRWERPPNYKAVLEREFCPPGVEKKDEALWERYLKQIKDSDGYDITDYPGPTLMTSIYPVIGFKQYPSFTETVNGLADTSIKQYPSFTETVNGFADAAIKQFNNASGEDDQYEVHDVHTVNVGSRGWPSVFYITFEAKKKKNSVTTARAEEENDHEGSPLLTTFQARVLKDHQTGVVVVEECRIKPSPA